MPGEGRPKFLGQELMRSALEASNLEPFEQPAAAMQASHVPLLERADAFKAIRFGLSGLVIQGWQESIVEQLTTPEPFGSTELMYRFSENEHFPVHDYSLKESVRLSRSQPRVQQTQGDAAFKTLRAGFEDSMRQHVEGITPQGKGSETIPVSDVVKAMVRYINIGKEEDLDRVADMYYMYQPLVVDIFQRISQSRSELVTTSDVIRGFSAVVAGNIARFTEFPIKAIMNHCADPENLSPPFGGKTPDRDSSEVPDVLSRTMKHILRLSQRQDGSLMVATASTDGIHVHEDTQGALEVTWNRSHGRPAPRVKDLKELIADEPLQLVLARNKCPIGYTPDAFSPMPMTKLGDAMLNYLVSNNLHNPDNFVLPKVVYAPPGARE